MDTIEFLQTYYKNNITLNRNQVFFLSRLFRVPFHQIKCELEYGQNKYTIPLKRKISIEDSINLRNITLKAIELNVLTYSNAIASIMEG